jgi:hypothetical protein
MEIAAGAGIPVIILIFYYSPDINYKKHPGRIIWQ